MVLTHKDLFVNIAFFKSYHYPVYPKFMTISRRFLILCVGVDFLLLLHS